MVQEIHQKYGVIQNLLEAMECYGNYGMVLTNPYKHMQHKAIYPPYNSKPQSRPLRKSIIPYSSYLPPPPPHPPIYYAPPAPPLTQLPPSSVERRFSFTIPAKTYTFTAKDIDAVLYGYLGDENNTTSPFHSLSGVKLDYTASLNRSHNASLNREQQQQRAINISHPDLPSSLNIKEILLDSISHTGIFAKEIIPKGTRFGPFKGKIIKPRDLDDNHSQNSWEVFNKGRLVHYISASCYHDSWMRFINCARYNKEQNLCIFQNKMELYYETIEVIKPDQELLVWYGDKYTKYMEIPFTLIETKDDVINERIEPNRIERIEHMKGVKQIKQTERKFVDTITDINAGSYPCTRCGKIFSYEYYREKHLKYTRCVDKGDRKFPCHLCQRSFEKKDRLRIHILHVHQKYRPHVCKTCGKRFSQSSSLNKHSRVHTGERPYACPHCPKSFTASSILRTHLRQHNGERPFKCKFCGKAFASHAAHDSHVRRTHEKLKTFLCHVCTKTFSMAFELKFHLSTHTRMELENAKHKIEQNGRIRGLSEQTDTSLVIDIEGDTDVMEL